MIKKRAYKTNRLELEARNLDSRSADEYEETETLVLYFNSSIAKRPQYRAFFIALPI